jgi:hypothetical protein
LGFYKSMKPNISDLIPWFPLKHSIERFYPFTFNELKELEVLLDFSVISCNQRIEWTEAILEEFSLNYCWAGLSSNPSVKWTPDLIEKYKNYIDWHHAAGNKSFPWTKMLFFRFKDLMDWDTLDDLPIRLNADDIGLLKKEQIWNLARFENVEWEISLIERYKDQLDWICIGRNRAMPYSEYFFNKYKHKICYYIQFLVNSWLLRDENLPFMEKFAMIEFGLLSEYKEDWTLEFIEEHEDQLNWDNLSLNEHLPWSREFLMKYEEKWNWFDMSGNKSVPWTWELIEKHEHEWNWREDDDPNVSLYRTMTNNPSLPWSRKFVERFGHHLSFGSTEQVGDNEYEIRFGVSSNQLIDWDIDFLLKYKDLWDIEALGNNEAVYSAIENHLGKGHMCKLLKFVS